MSDSESTLYVQQASQFRTHHQLSEAIDEARQGLLPEHDSVLQHLAGKPICGVAWGDVSASFVTESGFALTMVESAYRVRWTMETSLKRADEHLPGGSRFRLVYSRSGVSCLWNRRDLLEERIGDTVKMIQRAGDNVFLYTRDHPPLLFCVLTVSESENAISQRAVLHWDVAE